MSIMKKYLKFIFVGILLVVINILFTTFTVYAESNLIQKLEQ